MIQGRFGISTQLAIADVTRQKIVWPITAMFCRVRDTTMLDGNCRPQFQEEACGRACTAGSGGSCRTERDGSRDGTRRGEVIAVSWVGHWDRHINNWRHPAHQIPTVIGCTGAEANGNK